MTYLPVRCGVWAIITREVWVFFGIFTREVWGFGIFTRKVVGLGS